MRRRWVTKHVHEMGAGTPKINAEKRSEEVEISSLSNLPESCFVGESGISEI